MLQRWKEILKHVNEKKVVTVNDLSERVQVSEVTIRKDLKELEKRGWLIRTHGGASAISDSEVPPFFTRERIEMDEKYWIAQRAAELIEEGDSVLVDSGTTPLAVARFLKNKKVTIVTNSVPVGMELADYKGTVAMTGGVLLSSSMALCGPDTEKFLDGLTVNKLILGTSGVRIDSGLTTSSAIEAAVKKKMIAAADKVILVMDHSKFRKISLSCFSSFTNIDILVTSSKAPMEILRKIEDYGVQIVTVDLDEVPIDTNILEVRK